MTARIACWDVDEVIADLKGEICSTLRHADGSQVCWTGWKDYHALHDNFGITPEQFMDRLRELKSMENCSPEPGAAEALEWAKTAGYTNICVTARGWHSGAKRITMNWLKERGMGGLVDDVLLVGAFDTKWQTIAKLGDVEFYVEDSFKHVSDAVRLSGVKNAFLVDRPWNRGYDLPEKVTRVESALHAVSALGEMMEPERFSMALA